MGLTQCKAPNGKELFSIKDPNSKFGGPSGKYAVRDENGNFVQADKDGNILEQDVLDKDGNPTGKTKRQNVSKNDLVGGVVSSLGKSWDGLKGGFDKVGEKASTLFGGKTSSETLNKTSNSTTNSGPNKQHNNNSGGKNDTFNNETHDGTGTPSNDLHNSTTESPKSQARKIFDFAGNNKGATGLGLAALGFVGNSLFNTTEAQAGVMSQVAGNASNMRGADSGGMQEMISNFIDRTNTE